jgi:hypothetical protein
MEDYHDKDISCTCGELFYGNYNNILKHKCQYRKDLMNRILFLEIDKMMDNNYMESLPCPIVLLVDFGGSVDITTSMYAISEFHKELITKHLGKVSKKGIYIFARHMLLDHHVLVEKISKKKNICSTCRKECGSKCSRCNIEHYCSRDCQSKDWQYHKKYCNKLKTIISYYDILREIWEINKQSIMDKINDMSGYITITVDDLSMTELEITTNTKKRNNIAGSTSLGNILYVKKHNIYINL